MFSNYLGVEKIVVDTLNEISKIMNVVCSTQNGCLYKK